MTSRLDYSESEDRKIPFPWIESLHPLYPAFTELKGKVSGELPEDYAVFQKEKYFRAEASDGTRIRIGTTENEPRGDGKFWQEALGYNLRGKYADVRKENLGPFLGVLLTSKDSKPYYYFVGVSPRGKKLHVAELFFPDKKTYDERFSSLKDIFRGIRIR